MGQQPNIPLEIADLPRPVAHPDPPRRWSPSRPGELGSPDDVPWGGAFGTPGPDTGFALKLAARRDIPEGPRVNRRDVVAAVAALAAARASAFGRAPVDGDLDVALVLLGFDTEGVPAAVRHRLEADRPGLTAHVAHRAAAARRLVAAVPSDVLTAEPDDLRRRLASGESLIATG